MCRACFIVSFEFISSSVLRGRYYYLAPFANMETRVKTREEVCPRSHSSLEEGWDGSPGSLSGTHTPTFSIITLSEQFTLLQLPPVHGWT